MSENQDLVAALLEGDPATRESLLRMVDPADLGVALQRLGERREVAAAEVLTLVDLVVEDRGLRKVARRELHRLRSSGIHAPQPVRAPTEPAVGRSDAPLPVTQAWVTDIDPSGTRAVWLLGERPLGGAWFAVLLLNDQQGLQDMSLLDTTRKRFAKEFDNDRSAGGVRVLVPGAYALRLIREAVELTRAAGRGLPTRYRAFREVFGEAPSGPERALVYETISPVEASFNPDWLEGSARLLGEPELAGWHIAVSPDLKARALEVAHGPVAGLLVPGHAPEQEALHLIGEAARALTPSLRLAFRRRLEETGYIFVATDRLAAARLAVAAARALEDPATPPERHPFVRVLLEAGLARLVGAEQVGSRPAADLLIERIERASQPRSQTGPTETRPSGLILPR